MAFAGQGQPPPIVLGWCRQVNPFQQRQTKQALEGHQSESSVLILMKVKQPFHGGHSSGSPLPAGGHRDSQGWVGPASLLTWLERKAVPCSSGIGDLASQRVRLEDELGAGLGRPEKSREEGSSFCSGL